MSSSSEMALSTAWRTGGSTALPRNSAMEMWRPGPSSSLTCWGGVAWYGVVKCDVSCGQVMVRCR